MRRTARASARRRSTRSTCSPISRRSVSFTKPGRDTSASPIEEVFLEAKAEDDYGVKIARARLQRQRRRAEDGQAVRRHDAHDRRVGGPHAVSRRAGRASLATRSRTTRAPCDNDTVAGAAEGDERHVFHPRAPAARRTSSKADSQAAAAVARRAAEPGRRAVRAGAADHRGDVQPPARSQDHDRRSLQESTVVVGADAEAAARAGRPSSLQQFRRRASATRPRALQEDHRLPEAERARDADRRRQAAGGEPRQPRCRRSSARSSSCRRRKKSTSCR